MDQPAAAADGGEALLPVADFLSVGRDVKERLRALKEAKALAAKAVRPAASADDDFSILSFSTSSVAAAAAPATPAPHERAQPLARSLAASPATPAASSSSKPIGFGADEEFISLAFSDDEAAPASSPRGSPFATPARGTKRKSLGGAADADDVDEGVSATPGGTRTVTEGAYRAPWACSMYTQPNFTLRLHEEILDFCTYVSPKPAEQAMREQLIRSIEGIAREAFPNAPALKLKPFGSYATSLYLPISDIDLVLVGVDRNHATAPSMDKGKNSALGMLERTMRSKQNATYLEHISGARIPILKFTDKATGVKIDICYEIEGGLAAAEFIVRMQGEMPALRPLTLFLKYFLHCRVLNDTYKGGIGSFMLQLMLISHLQQLQFAGRLNRPNTNLGMLLMSFLECYGVSLNYKHAGLNMNASGNVEAVPGSARSKNNNSSVAVPSSSSSGGARTAFFSKSSKGWFNANRPYLMSIENPLDPKHDVGSNSYLILRVRKALQFAYQTLAAHVHYEALARERGENPKKKKRKHDLLMREAVDPAHPFAAASHTPQTLLSHIVSVNEPMRPGQTEVEFDDMPVQQTPQRSANVHRIESSEEDDDEEEEGEIKQPVFGEVDLTISSDSEASSSSSSDDDVTMEDGEVDARGDMSRFESRFQVDHDDQGSSSDDEPAASSAPRASPTTTATSADSDDEVDEQEFHEPDSDESYEDEDGGSESSGEIDSDGEYASAMRDVEELFTTPASSKRNLNSLPSAPASSSRSHSRPSSGGIAPDEDFIPLSGFGGGGGGGHHGGSAHKAPRSGSRKKSASYNFDHTPHPRTSQSSSKKKSKKGTPLLRGHKTEGKTPNSQLFESNRSKARKQSKKKQSKQRS